MADIGDGSHVVCKVFMCVADALPSALCAFVGGYASISAFHLRHLRSHALLPRSACVEWRETTVHHHRACFGVKNRRYTRLRKAFTAWRQASHGDEGHEGREAPEQGRPEGDTIDTVAASV